VSSARIVGLWGKSFVVDGQPRTLIGVMPERFHGFGAYKEIFHGGEQDARARKKRRKERNSMCWRA